MDDKKKILFSKGGPHKICIFSCLKYALCMQLKFTVDIAFAHYAVFSLSFSCCFLSFPTPTQRVELHLLDLSLPRDVLKFANEFVASEKKLDVLVSLFNSFYFPHFLI